MKKILSIILVLALAVTIISVFAACNTAEASYEIALVTDVGNIDDKSFNEGAWNGVKEYATENNISYGYFRPSEDSTEARVETIKTAIARGAKMIVCPGYLFETAIYNVQDLYPDVDFILLDGQPHTADYETYNTADNVYCILYQEEQAGYLAGYAAVQEGYTKLGFLGGIDVPAVIRYGFGYIQGAEAAATEMGLADGAVTMNYWYSGSFNPTAEIQTKMSGWYSSGTEVVFSCGGGIYLSAVSAAGTTGKVIGVDVDQSGEADCIITSAMKMLTHSVKLALTSYYANDKAWDTDHAGITDTLGAAQDCVGLPTSDTAWRLSNFTVEEYNTLFASMKAGNIAVSNSTTTAPTTVKVVVDFQNAAD